MEVFDLRPIGNQKSFYGKALVVEDDAHTHQVLRSYGVEVAEVRDGKLVYAMSAKELMDQYKHCRTTRKHIKAFIERFVKEV